MIHTTINLPKRRLRIEFTRRRYGLTSTSQIRLAITRRKAPPQLLPIPAINTLGSIRVGSKLSRLARIVLGRINLKSFVGRNLSIIALTSGLLFPTSNILAQTEPEVNILPAAEPQVTTEIKIRYPVDKIKINQGYHRFHPGIDLGGKTGNPVYPIMAGTVELIIQNQYPYGNAILINHKNGIKSFYAHLNKSYVAKKDNVNTKQPIGEIGKTGRATGPHLHLEVYKNGQSINPRSILKQY